MRGLTDAAKKSGVPFTSQQREAIMDELVGVLEKKGFVVKENERLYTGEEDIEITQQNAPKLKTFLDTIAQKNPQVFKLVLGLFNRGALDISSVAQDITDDIPSILTVADPEPEEDQTDTVTTEPVDTPDEEEQEATIATEPVAAPDPEEEADDFEKFFLSLDDETLEEFFSSVEKDDVTFGTIGVGMKVVNHLFDSYGRIYGLSPQETYEARQELLDDQRAALASASYEDLEPILRKAEQKMIAFAKDILAKRNRLTEHKQLKRIKVLAGVK